MKLTLRTLLVAVAALSFSLPATAATLKVGVVPGVYADSIEALIPEAKAKGLDLEVVEFSDWTTPNIALQSGDIDVNYFQHQPFLDNATKERGYDFKSAGIGVLANIGLYSLKYKKFEDIPENGKVAIANDPVNQGRGLLLLQRAGLLKLKDGVGFKGSLDDITENPKNLSFTEVEGPQLARVTGDVDLAQGYPHFIVASKAFDPSSGLLYSGVDDKQFAIIFAVKSDRVEDPAVRELVTLYQNSQAVKDAINKAFASDTKLYTLPWVATN
ncbi:MetQ/NlpA family ABC transporter substrate-binding protein [Rhizobium lentis]|uniref:MetQ/NlpA family ABC transporter substrate-binding protein n=1 Tax=Rhizobium TaxID=379 RepID=UPI00161EB9F9|nr:MULTISPECIES: MetQ/NlpA family ABC transporter substrate-binding protein [Rhizobium]MBB3354877.1 D-methionine transport system substrate-binding protein [Rhizobium sp. BK049]MBX5135006.1 MetQ/NlpA family ABC transporter substrate-binding protein [Rhizobium lentis]MBX5140912.1 MetQ/NlpA family ABC transporter substrate-binding protein [Rhizobium lentis]MBX5153181.1 MetQ/NlpA family ABC transporter substrate-binding protein [Rhizobium lentis]MBX5178240.1 MetQ/NlpA family ABC transporter subst